MRRAELLESGAGMQDTDRPRGSPAPFHFGCVNPATSDPRAPAKPSWGSHDGATQRIDFGQIPGVHEVAGVRRLIHPRSPAPRALERETPKTSS